MTDTTAPRTAAGADHVVAWERLGGSPVAHDIAEEGCEGCAFIDRTRAEAIEPLLALVRAAAEVAREDAMSQPKRTASVNALRATYRALPESVRVAANREERPRKLSTESDGGSSDDAIRVAARKP